MQNWQEELEKRGLLGEITPAMKQGLDGMAQGRKAFEDALGQLRSMDPSSTMTVHQVVELVGALAARSTNENFYVWHWAQEACKKLDARIRALEG